MGYKDSSPRIDAEINLNDDVVVVTNAACLMLSDEGPRNSSQQKARCIHVVSRSFEHSGGESTIWLGYTQILSRTPWKGSGASHLSSSTTNLMRGFEARRLFRVPPCLKGTIRLQRSMSSTVFEPRPNGTVVYAIINYTGRVTY
ncbi:hypothetical protein TNCV_2205391 [Trichonephila clavipes]|nr:hypothetical protein TNCV_2205391 [Trichonephila clavipes]